MRNGHARVIGVLSLEELGQTAATYLIVVSFLTSGNLTDRELSRTATRTAHVFGVLNYRETKRCEP